MPCSLSPRERVGVRGSDGGGDLMAALRIRRAQTVLQDPDVVLAGIGEVLGSPHPCPLPEGEGSRTCAASPA